LFYCPYSTWENMHYNSEYQWRLQTSPFSFEFLNVNFQRLSISKGFSAKYGGTHIIQWTPDTEGKRDWNVGLRGEGKRENMRKRKF
jgi:hypothetical protein